jgi:hypothetical protein
MGSGRGHELLPIAGAASGLVHEVLPAPDIVLSMVRDRDLHIDDVL